MHHADYTDAPQSLPQTPPANEPAPAPRPLANEPLLHEQFRWALFMKTPRVYCTILLVLGNLAVFGVMVALKVSPMSPDPMTMIDWGANYAPRTLDGELWRLLTCMFLHFGLLHLGMNMMALWNLGQIVERMFGHTGFFLLYLISGLAGSLASVVWNPNVVSAGASGAIFGIAGGLLAGAWKLRRGLPRAFRKSAWWLAVNVLVLLVVFAVINHFHPMIDNAAHVAGLISGSLIGLILAEPLPNPGRSRKKLRNTIVAITGTAALAVGIAQLANPPADVVNMELQYTRVETQVIRTLNSAEERWQAGAITPEEFAEILEKGVLPPWRDLHQSFENAGPIPEPNQEMMADLLKIIELREAGWERLIEGIRENDQKKERESKELLDEATEIIRRLNQKQAEG